LRRLESILRNSAGFSRCNTYPSEEVGQRMQRKCGAESNEHADIHSYADRHHQYEEEMDMALPM
jgi:hypothetical protein